ncbi:PorP/SprF family type IX secretion system membrane protein [Gaoshiqia sediminis]|uniref:Type IX secretion system membrane protein PorP/SprF n=1 Tax=Gaoshiqia sediminis TaxID=2986998 RepID=A0AA42CB67_9BACT|nr:type IX secretion system membrane protein PorP/SprF [Gaoshiqia sediminis]MCW0484832.1 type IX secretion system membrane protein PorP/SprF [Gaoshiqia sediminis]
MTDKNYIRRLIFTLLWFCAVLAVHAQQDPMYTQYMDNILTVNPAYAGTGRVMNVRALTRNQWVSLDGAPTTHVVSMHTPVGREMMGLGFSFLTDKIGPISQTGAYFDYSYRVAFGFRQYLSFGLKGGVNFYEARLSDLSLVDPNDPIFQSDVNQRFLPNVGLGLFFHSDRFYLGLSVPKMLRNTITRSSYTVEQLQKEELHYFLMTGYVFDVNQVVKFKPYFQLKYLNNVPLSVDISTHFLLYDKLWLGAMYRVGDAVGGMMQLQVTDQFKVGYSYDITSSDLNSFNRGTHEILVSYDFVSSRRRAHSPRYF